MRARRSDALVALMQAQLAQERFRANNASYGSLADAGVRPTSPAGHYRIAVVSSDAAGFELLASAVAGQARDTEVPPPAARARRRHAGLCLGQPTRRTANGADANRACWSR